MIAALMIFPFRASMAQNAGEHYFRRGNYIEAVRAFRAQDASDGKEDVALRYHLANTYLEMGRLNLELFELVLEYGARFHKQLREDEPQNTAILYYDGLLEVGRNNLRNAERRFGEAAQGRGDPALYARIWLDVLSGKNSVGMAGAGRLERQLAEAMLGRGGGSISDVTAAGEAHPLHNLAALLMLSDDHARLDDLLWDGNYPWTLLDGSEVLNNAIAGVAIERHYFQVLPLTISGRYFLRRADAEFALLLDRVRSDASRQTIERQRGLICYLLKDEQALECLGATREAQLLPLRAALLWERREGAEARQILRRAVAASEDPLAVARAAYFTAVFSGEIEAAIGAANRAERSHFEKKKRYDQEISALLAKIHLLGDDVDAAAMVLDRGFDRQDENDPLFLARYSDIMFQSGPLRHDSALDGAHRLQSNYAPARQLHYYLQGLVAAFLHSDGGRGVKSPN